MTRATTNWMNKNSLSNSNLMGLNRPTATTTTAGTNARFGPTSFPDPFASLGSTGATATSQSNLSQPSANFLNANLFGGAQQPHAGFKSSNTSLNNNNNNNNSATTPTKPNYFSGATASTMTGSSNMLVHARI